MFLRQRECYYWVWNISKSAQNSQFETQIFRNLQDFYFFTDADVNLLQT
jgi:hypothetical protein